MTDSDWPNYDIGDYNKTDFSTSDCDTERTFSTRALAGWMWELVRGLRAGLFASFEYTDLEWSARDGYYQYASGGTDWSSSLAQERLYGLGILYRQTYVIPALGMKLSYRPSARISVEGGLTLSSAVSCDDEDDHVYRSIEFTESFSGGTLVEPEIAAGYAITPKARLGLRISYRSIQGLRGDEKLTLTQDYTVTNSDGSTSTYPAGYTETYANGAGAALESLEVDLSFSFQL
ncbi:MAG: omptin family outer membrane protease [Treponema sp.]|nr:omptin family outer membrane protease [Treponema sp.]